MPGEAGLFSCERGGTADALVLETSPFRVWVQIPPLVPRFAFGYAWRSHAMAEDEACPAKPNGRSGAERLRRADTYHYAPFAKRSKASRLHRDISAVRIRQGVPAFTGFASFGSAAIHVFVAQRYERCSDTAEVTGSTPVEDTNNAPVAQRQSNRPITDRCRFNS